MGRILLLLVAMPIVCGPVSYLVGRVWKKARDIFVQSAAALELLLVGSASPLLPVGSTRLWPC